MTAEETERRGGPMLELAAELYSLNRSITGNGVRETLRLVRRVAREQNRQTPVLLDLMGPRYRLGILPEGPRTLRAGTTVLLGPESRSVDLPVDDPEFLDHLARGERVLVDNGLIELEIVAKRARSVTAKVVHGGVVSNRKGINLPDSKLPFAISEKDARAPRDIPEKERDYLLERMYPGYGNLVPRDIAARAIFKTCFHEGRGIWNAATGRNENEVYLDLTHKDEKFLRAKLAGILEIYEKFAGTDPRTLLSELLPASFRIRLFQAFLDAAVSEHVARMTAMKAATDASESMIKTLTRQYNRARQTHITMELLDIVGGMVEA